jgi:RNA polymerase sigma factor (sigma-70 family)
MVQVVSNLQNEFMLAEEELIKGCCKGERSMQKALYDAYCRKMMATCLRYAPSREEAEDILQEGFVKVFHGIRSFRKESRLDTWMSRIMINTALNHQRQKLYLMPMLDTSGIEIPESEDISLSQFHLMELIAVIQSLPDGCRIIFNLFAIEGYGHQEIARMLGISEGTSKSQYSRARILLRIKLSETGKEIKRYGE